MSAHWRHLANTTEPSICSGDEALYKIIMTTCLTRSTGTVHTSTNACLTNVTIRIWIWIRIQLSGSGSVTRSVRIGIRDPNRHQSLIICSLAHCQPSLKISCKSVGKFLRKVANRQTNRQRNNNDYISSLAEVIIIPHTHTSGVPTISF